MINLFVLPFHNIDPVLFEVGPLVVRWYALAYIAGIFIGLWMIKRLIRQETLWRDQELLPDEKAIDDLTLWLVLGIIIGGRLGYILFYNAAFYFSNPLVIFKIWEGGMSFHGGLFGVVLSIYLYSKYYSFKFLNLMDAVAAVSPIGLFFGRIANFINGELYGHPSDVAWAMVFPQGGDVARHPSQLYEAFLEGLVLFVLLYWLIHSKKFLKMPGLVTGCFSFFYGLFRFFVEFYREPDSHLGYIVTINGGGLTMGMLLSVPLILGGGYLAYWSFHNRVSLSE